MPEIKEDSIYLNFIEQAFELADAIPRYFSKYSNKIFCNKQKIVLLVLKQKLRTTYRDLIEFLKISKISILIGLNRIPHHTTLVKFAKKIKLNLLNLLLPEKKADKVAIDYSGFEIENKSYYYRKRFFMLSKRRNFMRTALLVDLDKQLILGSVINYKQGNDNTEFIKLLKNLNVNYVLADKGYDSRANRKFVFDKVQAIPQIPFRSISGRDGFVNRTASYFFDQEIYNQRSKVETVFSSIKRKYGSNLRSKKYSTQRVEVICKIIAYNVDRLITLYKLLTKGFSRALFCFGLVEKV